MDLVLNIRSILQGCLNKGLVHRLMNIETLINDVFRITVSVLNRRILGRNTSVVRKDTDQGSEI